MPRAAHQWRVVDMTTEQKDTLKFLLLLWRGRAFVLVGLANAAALPLHT